MSSAEERIDDPVEQQRTTLSAMLDRQRRAFLADGVAVMGYSRLTEAIDYINQRPAPLVAYWFGPDGDDFRTFVRNTRSGGVARNDFAAQMIPSAAPFGGVGRSGMGAYHGKAGFDTFSHYRTVVGNDLPFSITGTAAPPFGNSLRLGADLVLKVARLRTHHRLREASG